VANIANKPLLLAAAAIIAATSLVCPTVAANGAALTVSDRVDLVGATVGGWSIFGRTPAGLRRIFGAPLPNDRCVDLATLPGARCHASYRLPGDAVFGVIFERHNGRPGAATVIFTKAPPVIDTRLGNFLQGNIETLPQRLAAIASGAFVTAVRYTCQGEICSGVLNRNARRWHLTYGTDTHGAAFVTEWVTP
jgi:hypothetical protein